MLDPGKIPPMEWCMEHSSRITKIEALLQSTNETLEALSAETRQHRDSITALKVRDAYVAGWSAALVILSQYLIKFWGA